MELEPSLVIEFIKNLGFLVSLIMNVWQLWEKVTHLSKTRTQSGPVLNRRFSRRFR